MTAPRRALWVLAGMLAAITVADRALVLWPAHWAWVARELPPRAFDPYRIEAVLRATLPDRRNVPILGNSLAERGLDAAVLERHFAARGLRFPMVTMGSAPALAFGMLANDVADLEPRAAIFVAGPLALRSLPQPHRIRVYDVRTVAHLFGLSEIVREPGFHFRGLVGELNIFARHRRALFEAALVRFGRSRWQPHGEPTTDSPSSALPHGGESWRSWLLAPVPDTYPNANTRALAYLARTLRDRGARLVVVDAPVLPTPLTESAGDRIERYREFLRALSVEEDFELVESHRLPVFREEDFMDGVHPNESGRARFTAAVIDAIGARLDDGTPEGRGKTQRPESNAATIRLGATSRQDSSAISATSSQSRSTSSRRPTQPLGPTYAGR